MIAIEVIDQQLQQTQRTKPKPSENEVLIQVVAAGINRPDIMQRKGLYPPPKGASDIPGLEVSGLVVALGNKVQHIKTGDKVCALVTGGGYAEFCIAREELCLPIPEGYDFIQAAALAETFYTVWSNIFDLAQLKKSETILIHGGSSGIGTAAIQLAKMVRAKVFITAGSTKKCDFCVQLGADAAINYKQLDFVKEIQLLTQDQGVDVILDMIGGEYFNRNLKCMAYDARLVQIGIQNGPKVEADILPIMLKRLMITGSTLRNRSTRFKAQIARQLLQKVWPALESGKIMPIIDSTLPLQNAAQAHQLMESNQHMGKIILTVS